MSTVQMEGLLHFLQTLTLTADNKRWLSEHLIMPADVAETPNQQYVRESLTRAMQDVRSAEAEGRMPGRPVEDLFREFEA